MTWMRKMLGTLKNKHKNLTKSKYGICSMSNIQDIVRNNLKVWWENVVGFYKFFAQLSHSNMFATLIWSFYFNEGRGMLNVHGNQTMALPGTYPKTKLKVAVNPHELCLGMCQWEKGKQNGSWILFYFISRFSLLLFFKELWEGIENLVPTTSVKNSQM